MVTPPIVHLEKIEKKFAGVYALKGISFSIEPGEIRCLAGENGCGKSTLIKVISGFYKPDAGKINLNGYEYVDLYPIESITNGIQVIYQDFSLFPNLTVAENIAFNHHIHEKKKIINYKSIKEIATKGLERIGVSLDLDKIVGELNVADKQLVAIARALSTEHSRLIIMDEPTTALTHQEIEHLLNIINNLKKQQISTIFVSHKLRELLNVSDTITILRNGEKVAEGPISDFDEQKIAYFMTGRNIKNEKYTPPQESKETVIKVENISYAPHFENISFELKKGEILGITGLLGCGRNEIAEALYGIIKPTSGSITIGDKPLKLGSIFDAYRSGIGFVPEDRLTEGLFLPQSILNNVIVSAYKKLSNKFGMIDFKLASKKTSEKIQDLKLNTTNIDMPVHNLSGGNQQRVVISKSLISDDLKLLVLNGPTVGVDIGSKFEIHSKLKELASQGIGIIIISDDIPELLENTSRILMIHKGGLADELDPMKETVESLAEAILKEY